MKHSKIGASSSNRWVNCPGSVALSEQAPEQESSDAANEGTCAHSVLELAIDEAGSAQDYIGKEFNGWTVTTEMADAVQTCVDEVFRMQKEHGGKIKTETRFDLSSVHPGLFGTNDICISRENGTLIVIDYKHGMTPVEVKENKQLLYYALGAYLEGGNYKEIILGVAQPRAHHQNGPIRYWTVTPEYLRQWQESLAGYARATEVPNAPLVAGSHCKWCPAKGLCPKQKEASENALELSVTDATPVLPAVNTLSDEQIAKIIANKKQIEDFISEVKRAALHKLQEGHEIEGLKLVAGRSARVWNPNSETEVVEALGDEAYEKKLLSVAKAEKLMPKGSIDHLWTKIEGAETVAPEKDRRKAVKPKSEKLIIGEKKNA